MSALDTISGVAIGGFLITVAVKGNSPELIEQAKKDRGFLKWAVAVGVLAYIRTIPGMSGPVTSVIAIAFLALFIKNGTKIANQASQFWSVLGGEK
jgi:hypothetical protein